MRTIKVPDAPVVSCCLFGGPDMCTLIITTAANKMFNPPGEHANAGAVFAVDVGVKGCPANVFNC